MTEEKKTYSIALRLRRITYEDAFVAIPVSDTIIKTNDEGEGQFDIERFVAEAIRVGSDPRVEWKPESGSMAAHPIQCPIPEGRRSFDALLSYPSVDDASLACAKSRAGR